ncbi:MAG: hypothetical protein Q9168_001426 [Polycauliona sp. 1 TL-2023]
MSPDTPSQPSSTPPKRKAASPPDTSPDSPDSIETKKTKVDPTTTILPESPKSPPPDPLLGSSTSSSSPSDSELMPPPPPRPTPISPSRLPARPGTNPLTAEHLETAFEAIRNGNPSGTGRLTNEHLDTALRVLGKGNDPPPRPQLRKPKAFYVGPDLPGRGISKEKARFHAAKHLQHARDQLKKEFDVQGLNRYIAVAGSSSPDDPSTIAKPPPSPRPSLLPSPLPSPDVQKVEDKVKAQVKEGLGITNVGFDFALFGKGKGDAEASDEEGEETSNAPEKAQKVVWMQSTEDRLRSKAAAEKAKKEKASKEKKGGMMKEVMLNSRAQRVEGEVEEAMKERKDIMEDIARARAELAHAKEETERWSRQKEKETDEGGKEGVVSRKEIMEDMARARGDLAKAREEMERWEREMEEVVPEKEKSTKKELFAESKPNTTSGGTNNGGGAATGGGEDECENLEKGAENGKGKGKEKET